VAPIEPPAGKIHFAFRAMAPPEARTSGALGSTGVDALPPSYLRVPSRHLRLGRLWWLMKLWSFLILVVGLVLGCCEGASGVSACRWGLGRARGSGAGCRRVSSGTGSTFGWRVVVWPSPVVGWVVGSAAFSACCLLAVVVGAAGRRGGAAVLAHEAVPCGRRCCSPLPNCKMVAFPQLHVLLLVC